MMIKLYADENFRQPAVEKLGYDVLTAYEAGQATQQKRVVITYNRQKLHNKLKEHAGIIVFLTATTRDCPYDGCLF
jgi:hypothetical protein